MSSQPAHSLPAAMARDMTAKMSTRADEFAQEVWGRFLADSPSVACLPEEVRALLLTAMAVCFQKGASEGVDRYDEQLKELTAVIGTVGLKLKDPDPKVEVQ